MKAVVLESMNGKSAVLRDDGIMENVNKELNVGDTIVMEELTDAERGRFDRKTGRGSIVVLKRFIAAAAALILLFAGGGLYSFKNMMASSYVTVDVNPSFEFSLNRKDRVLEVKAINEDAMPIISQMNVKGRGIGEALGLLKTTLKANGYLQGDTSDILVDIVPENEKKRASIEGEVEKSLSEAVVVVSTKAERKEALEYKISTGRFVYAKANRKAGEAIDVESYRKKAVSEVVSAGKKPDSAEAAVVSGDEVLTAKTEPVPTGAEEPAVTTTPTPTPTAPDKKEKKDKDKKSDILTGDELQATPIPDDNVSDNKAVSDNSVSTPPAPDTPATEDPGPEAKDDVIVPEATPTPKPKQTDVTDGTLPPEAPEDYWTEEGEPTGVTEIKEEEKNSDNPVF
ncbi:MAG: hypothetical protein K5686_08775 [Lachnospiraceae bacterium]|nr:hypothetical protein [Lachnospiraceae bacterium]